MLNFLRPIATCLFLCMFFLQGKWWWSVVYRPNSWCLYFLYSFTKDVLRFISYIESFIISGWSIQKWNRYYTEQRGLVETKWDWELQFGSHFEWVPFCFFKYQNRFRISTISAQLTKMLPQPVLWKFPTVTWIYLNSLTDSNKMGWVEVQVDRTARCWGARKIWPHTWLIKWHISGNEVHMCSLWGDSPLLGGTQVLNLTGHFSYLILQTLWWDMKWIKSNETSEVITPHHSGGNRWEMKQKQRHTCLALCYVWNSNPNKKHSDLKWNFSASSNFLSSMKAKYCIKQQNQPIKVGFSILL